MESMLERLAHIKAVVSDWDDTKVATFPSCLTLYQEFAREHGLPEPTEADLDALWGRPVPEINQGLFPNENPEDIEHMFYAFVDYVDFCIEPFPTTEDDVLHIRGLGYHQGVVSSAPRRGLQKTLDRHLPTLHEAYAFIHSACDSTVHKPDRRVFDPGFEILRNDDGITEDEIVYVGDGLYDYQASKARGIPFIAVTTGRTKRKKFIQEGLDEDFILTDFSQLPALLREHSRHYSVQI